MGTRILSVLSVGVIAVGLTACAGRSLQVWHHDALNAELSMALRAASERFQCDSRRLDADILVDDGRERQYRVAGCNRTTTYTCTSAANDDNHVVDTECVHDRTGRSL